MIGMYRLSLKFLFDFILASHANLEFSGEFMLDERFLDIFLSCIGKSGTIRYNELKREVKGVTNAMLTRSQDSLI